MPLCIRTGLNQSGCWGHTSEPNRLKKKQNKNPGPHEVWEKIDNKRGNQVCAPGYKTVTSTLEECKAGKGGRRLGGGCNFK